jgi:LacI family transcriptional regulator
VYAQRFRGYKDALSKNGILFDEKHVLIKDLSEKCGREAAEQILAMNPRPDAAFITNDFSAAVCMQTLKEHGVRIPEDIAIVGFNNDAISIEIGEITARNIIAHLKGEENLTLTNTIIVKSELIIRKSSLRKG